MSGKLSKITIDKIKEMVDVRLLLDRYGVDYRNYGSDAGIIQKIESFGIKLKHLNPIQRIVKYSPTYKFDEIYKIVKEYVEFVLDELKLKFEKEGEVQR